MASCSWYFSIYLSLQGWIDTSVPVPVLESCNVIFFSSTETASTVALVTQSLATAEMERFYGAALIREQNTVLLRTLPIRLFRDHRCGCFMYCY